MDDETRQRRLKDIQDHIRKAKGTWWILADPAEVDEWRELVSEAGVEERIDVLADPEQPSRNSRISFSNHIPERLVAGNEASVADLERYVEQMESALAGIKSTISRMKGSWKER